MSAREVVRNNVKEKLARGEVVASMTVRLARSVEIARIAKTAGSIPSGGRRATFVARNDEPHRGAGNRYRASPRPERAARHRFEHQALA
jgi:hypothetical protein